MIPTSLSWVGTEVIIMTTANAISDDKVGTMKTVDLQYLYFVISLF